MARTDAFQLLPLKNMKLYRVGIAALLLILPFFSFGKDIRVIVGLSKPPYVIEDQQSGYEIELVTEILNQMDYQPEFLYVPMGRSKRLLDNGVGDALMTVNNNIIINQDLISKPYIVYQNVAITKKDSDIVVDELADLKHYRVVAFQMANKLLGSEYAHSVLQNANYMEIPDQFRQVKLLLEGKMDVAVMDVNIFKYFLGLVGGRELENKVTVHNVFPRNPYSMAFKDAQLVGQFNQAIARVMASDKYQELLKKYRLLRQASL